MSRETLRSWMIKAKLWRAKPQRVEKVHTWRTRRSHWGELVQMDTSEHDWLEGRGPKLYLISTINDATSRMLARFVEHDSTEENMRLLASYLERHGRPVSIYTNKATLFANLPDQARRNGGQGPAGIAAHSDRTSAEKAGHQVDCGAFAASKSRIERSFDTAQDRLVKGLRVAKAIGGFGAGSRLGGFIFFKTAALVSQRISCETIAEAV